MVLVTLRCRPKNGYHYVGKIKSVTLDSSARLEVLLQRSTAADGSGGRGTAAVSAHAALYLDGRKLPLNTAIATHNLQENVILETCKSPVMSAVLSAVMKDLNYVQKIPEKERNRETIGPLVQVPPEFLTSDEYSGYWTTGKWRDSDLSSRIACLATMKKALQRDDRYAVHDLDPCVDCHSLHRNMQAVWDHEERNKPRARGIFGSNRHLFKPITKRSNGPSTLWLLVDYKFQQQQQIAATYDIISRDNDTNDGSESEDALEEFIRLDEKRRGSGDSGANNGERGANSQRRRTRRQRDPTSSPAAAARATPAAAAAAAATTAASTTNTNRTTGRAPKVYCPEFSSGPFAVLCALMEAVEGKDGRRELSLTEDRLKKLAQPRCRANFYDRQTSRSRNAFACMEGLVSKGLLKKEMADREENGLWMFEEEGEKLGRECLRFERAFDTVIPPHVMESEGDENGLGNNRMPLLIVDDREDSHYRQRLRSQCQDDGIEYKERSLPAGDYLFTLNNQFDDEEEVLPLVIERKSWTDLADSVLDKGSKKRRLDCVRIGTNWSRCEGRNCQLCKMKRSGCAQVMFIIEGTRCRGRDVHRPKCSEEKRCQACKALQERHGPAMIQDKLERVLHRLQVDHGCYVHFTRNYNETIFSLFTMRSLLRDGESFALSLFSKLKLSNTMNGITKMLSYKDFCSNAGSSQTPLNNIQRKKGSVIEWEAQDFANKILDRSSAWKIRLREQLLGTQDDIEKSHTKRSASNIENPDGGEQAAPKRRRTEEQLQRDREMKLIFEESQQSIVEIDLASDDDEDGADDKREIGIEGSQGSIHLDESQEDSFLAVDESQDSIEIVGVIKNDKNDEIAVEESQDSVEIVEEIADGTMTSATREKTDFDRNKALEICPLLLIKGWDDYEEKRSSQVNKFWQKVYADYRSALARDLTPANTTTEPSTDVMNGLRQNDISAESYVRRQTFMSVTLWIQIKLGVNIRTVERETYATHMKEGWKSEGNLNYSLLTEINVPVRRPAAEQQTPISNQHTQSRGTPSGRRTRKETPLTSNQRDHEHQTPTSNQLMQRATPSSRATRKETPLMNNRRNHAVDNSTPIQASTAPPRPTTNGGITINRGNRTVQNPPHVEAPRDRPRDSQYSPRRLQVLEARLKRFDSGSASGPRTNSTATTSTQSNSQSISSPGPHWRCDVCTVINKNISILKCETCGDGINPFIERTDATSQTPIESDTWTCRVCTTDNDEWISECFSCGTTRDKWKCSKCTFENDLTANICSICEFDPSDSTDTPNPVGSSLVNCPTTASSHVYQESQLGHSSNSTIPRSISSQMYEEDYMDHVSSLTSVSGAASTSRSMDRIGSMDQQSSSSSTVKRAMRCGACKREGHNRASATAQNCPAYNDPKEVEWREKKWQKKQAAAIAAEQSLTQIQQEKQNFQTTSQEAEEHRRRQEEAAQTVQRLLADRENQMRKQAERLRRQADRARL